MFKCSKSKGHFLSFKSNVYLFETHKVTVYDSEYLTHIWYYNLVNQFDYQSLYLELHIELQQWTTKRAFKTSCPQEVNVLPCTEHETLYYPVLWGVRQLPYSDHTGFFSLLHKQLFYSARFRAHTWPHLPGTCLLCRWSSRRIRQICSWCDPKWVCTQPESLDAGGRWSTWLCLSETDSRRPRKRSSPQLCRHTPHIWFPVTGSWCGTCKQRGTRHRWSASQKNEQ